MKKLEQIENKMLQKIDKTRIEAERCREIKDQKNRRLQEKMRVLKNDQLISEKRREQVLQ